jgi:hypothetical protein
VTIAIIAFGIALAVVVAACVAAVGGVLWFITRLQAIDDEEMEMKRRCPRHSSCGGYRRQGEIFCHSCYFHLPKELRDRLWARGFPSLSLTIKDCKEFLRLAHSEPCRASEGSDLDIKHTCPDADKYYHQNERHSHDGKTCEDWAHCSVTSDEQKGMQK